MNENENQNEGTGAALTLQYVETLGDKTEGARHAKAMLRDVARTLAGVTCERATDLHKDFAEMFGRLAAATKKVKSAGSVVKWSGEADFKKAGFTPPLLCTLSEAADKVYKLRKLGCFPADVGLAVDLDKVSKKHGERWSGE